MHNCLREPLLRLLRISASRRGNVANGRQVRRQIHHCIKDLPKASLDRSQALFLASCGVIHYPEPSARAGIRSISAVIHLPLEPNGDVLMANVVVVGSQWGDEGKGKIVDWLS